MLRRFILGSDRLVTVGLRIGYSSYQVSISSVSVEVLVEFQSVSGCHRLIIGSVLPNADRIWVFTSKPNVGLWSNTKFMFILFIQYVKFHHSLIIKLANQFYKLASPSSLVISFLTKDGAANRTAPPKDSRRIRTTHKSSRKCMGNHP